MIAADSHSMEMRLANGSLVGTKRPFYGSGLGLLSRYTVHSIAASSLACRLDPRHAGSENTIV